MNCTICEKEGRVDGNTKDAKLWRCVDCGHCYTDVSDIKNNEKYANDYFIEKHTNWFEHPLYKFYDKIYQIISERFKNAKIIDVGCGQGDFLRYIKNKNQTI